MRFTIPQFIDVEDKIIGPLSVRQFLILLGGFGILFLLYRIVSFVIFILLGIPLFGLSGIFAFARINGQPFHYFLLNILRTMKTPPTKVWQKEEGFVTSLRASKVAKKTSFTSSSPRVVTRSKLAHLALLVDTGGVWEDEEF